MHGETCRRGNKETPQDLPHEWKGSTKFRKSWGALSEQTRSKQQRSGGWFSLHWETDARHRITCRRAKVIDLRAESDILDLRPTSQQGNRWNLRERKDQHEILWLIRMKHPKLVIGCGKCILFCTVLYHEQIRRGLWFLHDLSGDASQLSLPCMIRLECRHDVFHALGNARDRRDGERVSFLTNSTPFC